MRLLKLLTLPLLMLTAFSVQAGMITMPGEYGGHFAINVKSLQEKRFRTTINQKYDFSCGSAALATLLTFHYQETVNEAEIFKHMYENGDQEKIRREGFSLLDMKNYLEAKGFVADGFRTSIDKLANLGIPAIALINDKGYHHFVVIKGVNDNDVLLGDPASGGRVVSRAEFEAMHGGIFFLIRNNKDVAQKHFNDELDWRIRERAPISTALNRDSLSGSALLLQTNSYDF